MISTSSSKEAAPSKTYYQELQFKGTSSLIDLHVQADAGKESQSCSSNNNQPRERRCPSPGQPGIHKWCSRGGYIIYEYAQMVQYLQIVQSPKLFVIFCNCWRSTHQPSHHAVPPPLPSAVCILDQWMTPSQNLILSFLISKLSLASNMRAKILLSHPCSPQLHNNSCVNVL